MKIQARPSDRVSIPPNVEPFTKQRFVTAGKVYDVHAIQVYEDGIPFFLFVDDLGYPAWQPSLLFDVVDTSLPDDWRCNSFPANANGVLLVVGPDFLAKDETAVVDMIQLDAAQVDRFWKRVEMRESNINSVQE